MHTLGWPLRKRAKYREFGGSFVYPMGEDMVSVGFVVGLEYRDIELSAHDVLQEFKTHKFIRKILEGGERVALGREDDHEGGWLRCRAARRPGLLLAGESAGLVDLPRLKGVHYAIESGRLAAEAACRSLQRGEVPAGSARSTRTTRTCGRLSRWELARCATCARPSTRASSSVARSRAR